MKISTAIYCKGDFEEPINAKSLNRLLYNSKYRGFLFCPEDGCDALLSFVERKKGESGFFRTWSKKDHKEGCPYEVNYDKPDEGLKRKSEELNINVSDNHINQKLKRTYEKIILNIYSPRQKKVKLRKRKKDAARSEVKGESALFNHGSEINGGREPYILTRRFDKLDDTDVGKTRCIFGEVRNMSILSSHAYINLTYRTEKGVKIYFSEYFRTRNQAVFKNLYLVKQYIDELKIKKIKIYCCCIGWITKAPSGFNIHPDRYNGFILNGLGFYDIIRR